MKRNKRLIFILILFALGVALALISCNTRNHETVILAQLAPSTESQMCGYVLSDGEITIVFDGGTKGDAGEVVDEVKKLSNDDTVDAWFITHYHEDHTGALAQILSEPDAMIKIEKVYCNFPSSDLIQLYDPDCYSEYQTIETALEYAPVVDVPVEGNEFQIGEFTVFVLQSPDASITTNFGNNSSTIYKVETDESSILILGDAGIEAGDRLLNGPYKAKIKNIDYLQMAHHGQNGVSEEVYRYINPRNCLWPTPAWLWDASEDEYKTRETRRWMDSMNVANHYVAKDGLIEIKLQP